MERIKRLIGTKQFYKTAIIIMIPIMLQQLLTSLVNLADNVMIGRLSEDAVAGVAIAGQLIYIYFFALLGGLASAGIFISQFFGANDEEGVRKTFRFKILFGTIFFVILGCVLFFFGESIMRIVFDNDTVNEELAIMEGWNYLKIIIISLLPYTVSQLFSTTLREIGQTRLPMIAGIIAIVVNVVFNWILIFGKFGAPALGVEGAAIATVLSRVVEMVILILVSIKHKYCFVIKVFKNFTIGKELFGKIIRKGIPLFFNEILWTLGMTVQTFCYAMQGKTVVAALSISSSCTNILYISFAAMATGIAVMVGKELGANRLKEAEDNAYKLQAFAVVFCAVFGWIMAVAGQFIPDIYSVSVEAKIIAKDFIMIVSFLMPVFVYNVTCFFILRAGGVSLLTLIFDSVFSWVIVVPTAFILCKYTTLHIAVIYLCVQCTDLLKTILGTIFVHKKIWVRNLVSPTSQS